MMRKIWTKAAKEAAKASAASQRPHQNEVATRIRNYVQSRGGPAKDENGKYVGTVWPMLLEAADEIERLELEVDLRKNLLRAKAS